MPKVHIAIGRRITDSHHKKLIHVAQKDMRGAVCRDHQKCVIARAIQRQTGAPWVDVGACTVLIGTSDKTGKRYHLTPEAKEQVAYFDEKNAFAPCVVRLRPFHGRNRLGSRVDKQRPRKNGDRNAPRKQTTR